MAYFIVEFDFVAHFPSMHQNHILKLMQKCMYSYIPIQGFPIVCRKEIAPTKPINMPNANIIITVVHLT